MELMKNERKKLGLTATLHVKKGPLPDNRPFDLEITDKTNVDVIVNARRFNITSFHDNYSMTGNTKMR